MHRKPVDGFKEERVADERTRLSAKKAQLRAQNERQAESMRKLEHRILHLARQRDALVRALANSFFDGGHPDAQYERLRRVLNDLVGPDHDS